MSWGHIWEGRISANLFLTHYWLRGTRWYVWIRDRKEMEFSREKKKITKEKPVSQNAVCGKSFSWMSRLRKINKTFETRTMWKAFLGLMAKIQSYGFKKVKSSSNCKSSSSIFRRLHGPQTCSAQIAYYRDRASPDSKGQRFQRDFHKAVISCSGKTAHTSNCTYNWLIVSSK